MFCENVNHFTDFWRCLMDDQKLFLVDPVFLPYSKPKNAKNVLYITVLGENEWSLSTFSVYFSIEISPN